MQAITEENKKNRERKRCQWFCRTADRSLIWPRFDCVVYAAAVVNLPLFWVSCFVYGSIALIEFDVKMLSFFFLYRMVYRKRQTFCSRGVVLLVSKPIEILAEDL